MASPLGHSMMGIVLYTASVRPREWFGRWGWLFLLIIYSAAADFDYLPAAFGRLDIANMFHRKFTHTVLFALSASLLYLIIAAIFVQKLLWKHTLLLFIAMLAHLVIDILTLDQKIPLGIAPFEPFSSISLYGPFVVFPNVQKGSYTDILSLHNVKVTLFEIGFFGILIVVAGTLSAIKGHLKAEDE